MQIWGGGVTDELHFLIGSWQSVASTHDVAANCQLKNAGW